MLPIIELAEGHQNLAKELAHYDYALTAPLIAGFLTMPEYHANTLRLDCLAKLACCFCKGTRVPDRDTLVKCAGKHLSDSPLVKMEDPVEDAFIGNIATSFGNFRVFRGIEESGDFWAESLIRPLEDPHLPKPLRRMLEHVYALLTLSDKVAERLGLKRFEAGSGKLRGRLQIPQWRKLSEAARAVCFSQADIEGLGLSMDKLEPFILDEPSREQIKNEAKYHSNFDRFPLARLGDDLIIVAPHVITASVRRFVVEQLNVTGFYWAFEMMLHHRQAEDWFCALQNDFRFSPLEIELPSPPEGCFRIFQTAMAFDHGKYAHFVMMEGNLSGHATNFYEVDYIDKIQQEIFEKHLVACSDIFKKLPGYNAGMTLITRGGSGMGLLMEYQNLPSDWELIFAPLPDWHTLAGCDDMSALRIWRMCRQEKWAAKHGLSIYNVNGALNLYACWRRSGWRFLLRDMPLAEPHKLLKIESDFLTNLRREVDLNWDEHSCPAHEGQEWIRVRRRNPKACKGKIAPMYLALDRISKGQLLAMVETADRIWWIATKTVSIHSDAKSAVFQIWDCILNWLCRGATAIENALAGLPQSSFWIDLEFSDLEGWGDDTAENLSHQLIEMPYATVNVTARTIGVTIPANFRNAFHVPDNRAERAMIKCLARGVSHFAAGNFSEADLDVLMARIFPNADARFFHVLRTENLVQMLADQGPPSPDFIADEDASQSLIGLSQAIGGVPQGGKIQGDTECLAYLEKATNTLWERIERGLNQFGRRSVITNCLRALAELERDSEHWSMTSRALIALEENGSDAILRAEERRGKRDSASLTCRLLAETAMYACSQSDGKTLPDAERLALMADMKNLISIANHRDAISAGFMKALVHVFPNGELDIDEEFYMSVMLPYTSAISERDFRAAALSYDKWFSGCQRPDRAPMEETLNRLEGPFLKEFGITLDQLILIQQQIENHAVAAKNLLLEFDEQGLISFLKNDCRIDDSGAARYLERFSLSPRNAWNKNLPSGCEEKDVWPWRFRRQMSLLMRPLVLLSHEPQKRFLVYPPLIGRSNAYLLNGIGEAEFPSEHFKTAEMRSFCGGQANRQGNQFTKTVGDRLAQLGCCVRLEISMKSLGVPASCGDFGDVDVLAWKLGTSKVFVIECKYLRPASSVRDVVDRLEEFRGERDDYLAKHLRRLSWLKSNPSILSELTKIPILELKPVGLLVTDDLVPMQFFDGAPISKKETIVYNQLADFFC